MPFQWNVQPYQFLEDARAAYTSTIMLATRKRADVIRTEATQWMKDNAPWQDQTGRARASLRVSKMHDPNDREYENALAIAKNEDAMLLDEIQQSMREQRKRAFGIARSMGGAEGKKYRQDILTQKQWQVPRKLLKKESKVAALKRVQAGYKSPLVSLKFQYYKGPRWALWLEIANQGRYAIIARAIDYWSERLFNEVRRLANLKQYRDSIAFGPEISQEEQFASFIKDEGFEKGRPFIPWSQQSKMKRTKRRLQYNPEVRRQRYQENLEYSYSRGIRGTSGRSIRRRY